MIDTFFKDKHGHIVIWQTPNLPLTTWLICMLAAKFFAYGQIHNGLAVVAFGALFTWAWLEISSGASYFRRAVGIAVLLSIVWSRI